MSEEKLLVDKEGLERLIEQKLEEKEQSAEKDINKLENILHKLDKDDKIPDEAESTVALIVYMFFKTLVTEKDSAIKSKDDTITTLKRVSTALIIAVLISAIRQMFNIDINLAEIMALMGG